MAKRLVCITIISFCLSLTAIMSFPVQTDAAVVLGWGTPELAENSTGIAYTPDIAMDHAGNATIVWYQDDPPLGDSYNNIWANRYVVGSGWGEAQLLEHDDSGTASSPKVVMDGEGNAVTVWCQSDGDKYSIWSSRFDIVSGWSEPELIEDSEDITYFPNLAGNADGYAIATWAQVNGTVATYWANQITNATGWGTAQQIPVAGADPRLYDTPEVVMDSEGRATAVWRQGNNSSLPGAAISLWMNQWSEEGGWGTPELIEDTDMEVSYHRVAVDEFGDVFAVWESRNLTSCNIRANRFVVGDGWHGEELIESSTEVARIPEIDTDPMGNAIVVWKQINESDGTLSLWANRYVSGFGWEGADLVHVDEEPYLQNPYFSAPFKVRIAIDDKGNAYAVNAEHNTTTRITASHYIADDGWQASEEIDSEETGGFSPQVKADGHGNFIAIWQGWGGSTQDIWANRYVGDSEDPLTTAICSGTEGENGYYLSSVVLELDAVDTISGVDLTMYRLVGENWSQYTEPVEFSDDGAYELEFYSEDVAGNTEEIRNITFRIDSTPPEVTRLDTTGTVDLLAQDDSWYSSEVDVSITASDATSGVESIMYRVDEGEWQTYESVFTISSGGIHTVECFAVDSAGNNGSIETDIVKVDRSMLLMITSLRDETHVFSSDHLLTWTCYESDTEESGVYRFFVRVDDVQVGTYDASVREASLSGLSEGLHTIQVVGIDNAGNIGGSIVDIYVHSDEGFAFKLVVILVVAVAVIVITIFALFKWIKW